VAAIKSNWAGVGIVINIFITNTNFFLLTLWIVLSLKSKVNMKKRLLLVILSIQVFVAFAQQKSIRSFLTLEWSKTKIEKIHNQPIFDTLGQVIAEEESLIRQNDEQINFGSPVFSFAKLSKNGKRLREIQLSNFQIKRRNNSTTVKSTIVDINIPLSGSDLFVYSSSVAYLENFNLVKIKENFVFWLGGGLRLYNSYRSNRPKTTLAFPTKILNTNITLLLVPRITYKLSKSIILDIHSPLTINAFDYQYNYMQNPLTPIEQQRQHSFKYHYIPKINEIRLGLGVNF
jgi:hypothetical protein